MRQEALGPGQLEQHAREIGSEKLLVYTYTHTPDTLLKDYLLVMSYREEEYAWHCAEKKNAEQKEEK